MGFCADEMRSPFFSTVKLFFKVDLWLRNFILNTRFFFRIYSGFSLYFTRRTVTFPPYFIAALVSNKSPNVV